MGTAQRRQQTTKLPQWLGHIQLYEAIILWGLALLLGLVTGVGVWLFKQLIVLRCFFSGFFL